MGSEQELREEFKKDFGPNTDQIVEAHKDWIADAIADWWIGEISLQRKALEEKIEWMKIKYPLKPTRPIALDWVEYEMMKEKIDIENAALDKVLSLIREEI